MNFTIDIQNDAGYALDAARLIAAAQTVLRQQQAAPESTLTVVVTDDEAVAALNRQYRGVDSATDVLSFRADAPPIAIEDEPPYLGDLLIAYPYASAQAARLEHELGDSLALLVIHGTLHLLGYDHDTPARRAEMWQAQEAALRELGISSALVPALETKVDDH
ncbi:MAG: rRNA maturation RNase YbeY [Chloroflexi bacterium]|nr:rRNA maturation RNase YbeY [Chloroflexota bacterium]